MEIACRTTLIRGRKTKFERSGLFATRFAGFENIHGDLIHAPRKTRSRALSSPQRRSRSPWQKSRQAESLSHQACKLLTSRADHPDEPRLSSPSPTKLLISRGGTGGFACRSRCAGYLPHGRVRFRDHGMGRLRFERRVQPPPGIAAGAPVDLAYRKMSSIKKKWARNVTGPLSITSSPCVYRKPSWCSRKSRRRRTSSRRRARSRGRRLLSFATLSTAAIVRSNAGSS
jgi:hypothetical protein